MSIDTQRAFSSPRLVTLFNEWMRRFTDEPERFKAEFKTVGQFLQEEAAGKEPSYGAHCVGYLALLEDEMAGRVDLAADPWKIEIVGLDVKPTPARSRKQKPARKRKR